MLDLGARAGRAARPVRAGRAPRVALASLLGLALAGALTACGGTGLFGGGPVTTVPATASATLTTRLVPGLGRVLVASSGEAVYLFSSDPAGGSDCTGPCSVLWPPLVARGRVRADAGAHQRLVSSFRRSDGLTQVLYAGHALYTYQDDTSPGMVAGEGFTIYGGTWWLVAPSGKPVTG